MDRLRIICPNGHLGFAPTRTGSFERGLTFNPDMIACDSGSSDRGPIPLGSDTCASPLAWQIHDLKSMLLGARRLGIPMIIGSAGDSGSNSSVDMFVRIIRDLARKHGLTPFRIGWFHSEVSSATVRAKIRAGSPSRGSTAEPISPKQSLTPPVASSPSPVSIRT
jgi:hypothetical protein